MFEFELLKHKYASVLDLIKRRNVRLDHLHSQGAKLIVKGAAPNQEIKNEIWIAIKAVDSTYGDLSCDISLDSTLPAPPPDVHKYIVQPGDSLSTIAKLMYGDANRYMRIFQANRDKLDDPNKIRVGQELNIPLK